MNDQMSLADAINAELARQKSNSSQNADSQSLQSVIDAELNSGSGFLGRLRQGLIDSAKSLESWQIDDYIKEIAGGPTMSFADEGAARVASNPLVSYGGPGGAAGLLVQQGMTPDQARPTYDEAYQTAKQQREAFREENPRGSFIAQIGGSLLLPGGIANIGRQQIAKRLPGTDVASRVARALPMPVAAGATTAAVGVGEGEPGKRTDNIARDFAIGAAVQGGLQLAAPAARRFSGKMADVALPILQRFYQKFTTPEDSAAGLMRMLAGASDEFNFSKEQVASLQNRLMRGSGPTVAAAEDDSLLQLARISE